jgi:uncharacterized protein YkvS
MEGGINMNVNVGDKVIGIGEFQGKTIEGITGIVKKIYGASVIVHWDKNVNGWNCDMDIPNGYGWTVRFKNIKIIKKSKGDHNMKESSFIMPEDVKKVYFNENNVTVELKDGRKGTAVCQTVDNFDPYPGFCMAYYKSKNSKNFKLKKAFEACIENAKKKGYKTAIFVNR